MDRFKIGEKVYSTTALDEISLRDLMVFNTQAAEMGLAERWADIERIASEFEALSEAECEAHPSAMVMFGVTIWVSRRIAGDDVTLEQAVDIPLSKIEMLPDLAAPKDRLPKSAAKKKASSPAGGPAKAAGRTTPQTSESESSTALSS